MPFFSFVSFEFFIYIIQFTDTKKKTTSKVTSEREIVHVKHSMETDSL